MEKVPGKDCRLQEITGWVGAEGLAATGPQGCLPRSSRQDMKGRLSQGRQAGGAYGKEADVWEGRASGMWRGAKEITSDKHPRRRLA